MLMLGDTTIHLHHFKLQARFHIASQAIGGHTSNSERAEQGIKPALLTVSGTISFEHVDHLKQLRRLATATTQTQARVRYRITNDTANALDIKNVQFVDDVAIDEMANQRAWTVRFSLVEYHSVPEKIEERASQQPNTQPARPIENVPLAPQATQQRTGFEQLLTHIDNALAPSHETD